jgi:hypothetical protein
MTSAQMERKAVWIYSIIITILLALTILYMDQIYNPLEVDSKDIANMKKRGDEDKQDKLEELNNVKNEISVLMEMIEKEKDLIKMDAFQIYKSDGKIRPSEVARKYENFCTSLTRYEKDHRAMVDLVQSDVRSWVDDWKMDGKHDHFISIGNSAIVSYIGRKDVDKDILKGFMILLVDLLNTATESQAKKINGGIKSQIAQFEEHTEEDELLSNVCSTETVYHDAEGEVREHHGSPQKILHSEEDRFCLSVNSMVCGLNLPKKDYIEELSKTLKNVILNLRNKETRDILMIIYSRCRYADPEKQREKMLEYILDGEEPVDCYGDQNIELKNHVNSDEINNLLESLNFKKAVEIGSKIKKNTELYWAPNDYNSIRRRMTMEEKDVDMAITEDMHTSMIKYFKEEYEFIRKVGSLVRSTYENIFPADISGENEFVEINSAYITKIVQNTADPVKTMDKMLSTFKKDGNVSDITRLEIAMEILEKYRDALENGSKKEQLNTLDKLKTRGSSQISREDILTNIIYDLKDIRRFLERDRDAAQAEERGFQKAWNWVSGK